MIEEIKLSKVQGYAALLEEVKSKLDEYHSLGISDNQIYANEEKIGKAISLSYEENLKFLSDFNKQLDKAIIIHKVDVIIKGIEDDIIFNSELDLDLKVSKFIFLVLPCLDKLNAFEDVDSRTINCYEYLVRLSYEFMKASIISKNDKQVHEIYSKLIERKITKTMLNSLVDKDAKILQNIDGIDFKKFGEIRSRIFTLEMLEENEYPLADLSLIKDVVSCYNEEDIMNTLRFKFSVKVDNLEVSNLNLSGVQDQINELQKDANEKDSLISNLKKKIKKEYIAILLSVLIPFGAGIFVEKVAYNAFNQDETAEEITYESVYGAPLLLGFIFFVTSTLIKKYGFIDLYVTLESLKRNVKEEQNNLEEVIKEFFKLKDEMTSRLKDNEEAIQEVNNMFAFLIDTLGYLNMEEKDKFLITEGNNEVKRAKVLKQNAERINL